MLSENELTLLSGGWVFKPTKPTSLNLGCLVLYFCRCDFQPGRSSWVWSSWLHLHGGCCAAASKRTCIMEALTETPVFKDPDIASPLSAGLCVQQYVRKERKKEVPWTSGSETVMWRRTLLALRVPPLPPGQGTQQQQLLLGPQHLQPRLSLLLSTSPPIFCAAVIERLDPKPPFAFYEILHIPRHANQSQVC